MPQIIVLDNNQSINLLLQATHFCSGASDDYDKDAYRQDKNQKNKEIFNISNNDFVKFFLINVQDNYF
jgi:hypothetical protein